MRETRWFRLMVVALACSIFFVACGGGSDDDENGGDGEQTVTAEEWATSYCSAILSWLESVQSLAGDFQTRVTQSQEMSPEEKREELSVYLEDFKGLTEDFLADLEGAGTPDVEDGAEVVQELDDAFSQMITAIEDAKAGVPDISTESVDTYNAEAQALLGGMQTAIQPITERLNSLQNQELDQAVNDEPQCDQVQGVETPAA